MAMYRLQSLQKKLRSRPRFHEDSKLFMQTSLDRGYAEAVPDSELQREDGKTWYLWYLTAVPRSIT
jgi:hypothetical protein